MDLGVNAEKKRNGMYCMEPLRAGVVLSLLQWMWCLFRPGRGCHLRAGYQLQGLEKYIFFWLVDWF